MDFVPIILFCFTVSFMCATALYCIASLVFLIVYIVKYNHEKYDISSTGSMLASYHERITVFTQRFLIASAFEAALVLTGMFIHPGVSILILAFGIAWLTADNFLQFKLFYE